MKSTRKMLQRFFLLATLLVTFLAVGMVSEASTAESTVPKKVRIYYGDVNYSAIQVKYGEPGSQIKNLKTSNKNLKAKQSFQNISIDSYDDMSYEDDNTAEISLYAKKKGTYKVTFDICDADGNTLEKGVEVTVYAQNDSPFKKVTFNGKDTWLMQTKGSGKFKVVMNKGYKLKKIEYSTTTIQPIESEEGYKSVETWKTIKNGKKIKLNKTPGYYAYSYSYGEATDSYYRNRSYWRDPLTAYTYVKITYVDKYTKELTTTTYSLRTLAKDSTKVN